MSASLCETCCNVRKRKWINQMGNPTIICSKMECSVYSPRDVAFLTVSECNKYEEKRLTRQEFLDEESRKKGQNEID